MWGGGTLKDSLQTALHVDVIDHSRPSGDFAEIPSELQRACP